MDETAVREYIMHMGEGVDVVSAAGDDFYFYNPPGGVAPDYRFPFATLITGDRHDQASNLDRPDVYRLNVGVSKATFRRLFGADAAGADPAYEYAALDRLMPHPVYAAQHWVCVLNPSPATFASGVQPLLAEAYDRAVVRQTRLAARK